MTRILEQLGVKPVINACGPVTRLGGGLMHPDVAVAMVEASRVSVDMIELQAAACRTITRVTGAKAGIVTTGASAGILLGAAACLAGLDPGRMGSVICRARPDWQVMVPPRKIERRGSGNAVHRVRRGGDFGAAGADRPGLSAVQVPRLWKAVQ
jgi:hypothetical protein